MRDSLKAILLCIVMGAACSCSATFAGDKMDDQILVQDNAAFAIDLYRQLGGTSDGNIFFSPLSISTALGMTYAGARGDTEKQMAETLRFSLPSRKVHEAFAEIAAMVDRIRNSGEVELNIGNSLWPQKDYKFLEEYLSLVKKHYHAAVMPVDYKKSTEAAREAINQWVEDRTRDKIQELIKPGILDALTRLVLVNAIYFKGRWESPFDESFTGDAAFHVSPRRSVQVPMMAQSDQFGYARSGDLQILELPYAGGELSMLILLPDAVDGFRQVEADLTMAQIQRWRAMLRKQEIQLFLPRFKVTAMFRLDKTLAAMGMADAFTARADFRGMDGRRDLFIDAVIHQAYVEVNEEGTEAAAATAVIITRSAAPARPIEFRADHPFMFVIQENRSGSILFAGRMSDPGSETGGQ